MLADIPVKVTLAALSEKVVALTAEEQAISVPGTVLKPLFVHVQPPSDVVAPIVVPHSGSDPDVQVPDVF